MPTSKAVKDTITLAGTGRSISVEWKNSVFTPRIAERILYLVSTGKSIAEASKQLKIDNTIVYTALLKEANLRGLYDDALRIARLRKAESVLDYHLGRKDKNTAQFVARTLGKDFYSEGSEKKITKITGVYHVKEGGKQEAITIKNPKKG